MREEISPTACFCQQFTMPSAMIEAGTRVCSREYMLEDV